MYEYCNKENDEGFDYSLRKQVRFDTPTKSDPRLADLNVSKPFTFNTETPRTRTVRPLHSIENIYAIDDLPNAPISMKFNKTDTPRPSRELELSIFDSQSVHKPSNHTNAQRYQSSLNECEIPCAAIPERTTFPNTSTYKQNMNFNDSVRTTKSHHNWDENFDFFTRPNSNSNILERDDVPSGPRSHVNLSKVSNPVKNSLHTPNRPLREVSCKCNCKNGDETRTRATQVRSADSKRNAILRREQTLNQRDEPESYPEENCIPRRREVSNGEPQPTVSDLYDLIQLQIGHMKRLQHRVDELSQMKLSNRTTKYSENEVYSVQQRISQSPTPIAQEEEVHKISIGVMTSFEVTVKSSKMNLQGPIDEGVQTSVNFLNGVNSNGTENGTQTNNFLDGIERCSKKIVPGDDFQFRSPTTSTKVIANDGSKTRDVNLSFVETPSTPIVDDYDYSEDECSQPGIGWTFYKNFMNRINGILRSPPDKFKYKFQNPKVSIAELNQMGFNGTNINASSSKKVTFDFGESPPMMQRKHNAVLKPSSETSLHMNKLADKYLGASLQKKTKSIGASQRNYLEDIANESSFATLQYMQKYHLLGVPNEDRSHPNRFEAVRKEFPKEYEKPAYIGHDKILDITALKQQPKLL